MKPRRPTPLLTLAALLLGATLTLPAMAQSDTDPYLWLEDVSGQRALAWVRRVDAEGSGWRPEKIPSGP